MHFITESSEKMLLLRIKMLHSESVCACVQKFFGYANRLLQHLAVWLVSDDLGAEDAGCGGPGLV